MHFAKWKCWRQASSVTASQTALFIPFRFCFFQITFPQVIGFKKKICKKLSPFRCCYLQAHTTYHNLCNLSQAEIPRTGIREVILRRGQKSKDNQGMGEVTEDCLRPPTASAPHAQHHLGLWATRNRHLIRSERISSHRVTGLDLDQAHVTS